MPRTPSNRRKGGAGWLKRQFGQRPKPLWMVITFHILALAVALNLYALPHHVFPRQEAAIGITSSRAAAPAMADVSTPSPEPSIAAQAPSELNGLLPAASESPSPTLTPAPTDAVGSFRVKFADKFTSGDVQTTDLTYASANISVSFSTQRYGDSNINIADIYVSDISCLCTAFGTDRYGRGSAYAEHPTEIAQRYHSVATLSGDYYGARSDGVVIRNGTLYRDNKVSRDVCVLYWDGTMKVFSPGDFDAQTEMNNGAYQAWNFGPMLLDPDGQVMTEFNSDVNPKNPRSILGYYEPGHYCFIMVEGRSDNSEGLTLKSCSQMAADMGLAAAYNLDGGQSASLVKAGTVYGTPYKGGRHVSDVIMVLDSVMN